MNQVRICLFLIFSGIGLGYSRGVTAADCQMPQAPTNGTETISCTSPRPNTEVWRIDRPNISQRQTIYSVIRFKKGDLVSVFAGGCAQTGGFGLTWKRYANPMSPGRDDDNQYYGLINVPGFGALRHIRDAILQGGIPILAEPGDDAALTLGYADDGYDDNGYWGHDDGWWQQCNDLPDAWAVIAIQHDCAASTAPECIRGRALDIVADSQDENGFPINPDWVWRRVTGTSPNASDVCSWSNKIGGFPVDDASLCASQLTQRDSWGVCVQGGTAGGIAGHMNWTGVPVTYNGWIWWDGHDYYWDDDYTLNVAALDKSGHVSGSLFVAGQYNPQIEFDSEETIDLFDGIPWWRALHSAVDKEDQRLHTANAIAAGAVRPDDLFPGGTEAIIIGQLGLDCAHSCGTELHPAWAVFVHVRDDLDNDTWAFFVRNWGDEGFCSENNHQPGMVQQFTVRLPQVGATSVAIRVPETIVGTTQPVPPYTIALAPEGDAALATFTLPPAESRGIIYGELHLQWKRSLSAVQINAITRRASSAGISAAQIEAITRRAKSPQQSAAQIEAITRRALSAQIESDRPTRSAESEGGSTEHQLTRRLETLSPTLRDSVRAMLRPPSKVRRVEVQGLRGRADTQITKKPLAESQIRAIPLPRSRDLEAKRDQMVRQVIKESTP